MHQLKERAYIKVVYIYGVDHCVQQYDNLAATDTRSHDIAFPPSRYAPSRVDGSPISTLSFPPVLRRRIDLTGTRAAIPRAVHACLPTGVLACVYAPIHTRARGVATTRVPAASSISRIRRDLICSTAATTPAKRIFDLVRGEVWEKIVEGTREKPRTTGRQEGHSVPERTAAAFCESDALLKPFFRVKSEKSRKFLFQT